MLHIIRSNQLMGFSQPTEDTLAHSCSSSSQSPHLRPEKSPSPERERTIPNWEMLPNGILQIGPNLMRNIKWGELWNNPLERIGFISGGNSAALRVQHIVRVYTDQLNFPYFVCVRTSIPCPTAFSCPKLGRHFTEKLLFCQALAGMAR